MKNNNNIISIGLPCYNEEKNIIDVINKLISALNENFFNWEIIVVDNCSTDKTLEILENFLNINNYPNISLIKNSQNIFYSGSVKKIIEHSKYDVVGIMDSDNQYEPTDFYRLFEFLKSEKLDLVIGYRKNRKDSIFRKFISKVFLIISKVIISNNLNDLNCGIRVLLKNKKIENYISNYINFCNPELFVRYRSQSLKVGQLDVKHHDRSSGNSIHNIRNLIKTFFVVIGHLIKLRS